MGASVMLQWYEFSNSTRGILNAKDVQLLTDEYASGYERLLGSVLPLDKDSPIYDAGCGPGGALSILRTLGYRNLKGSDLSASAIAIARELGLMQPRRIRSKIWRLILMAASVGLSPLT